jgi:MscS family membrane protein
MFFALLGGGLLFLALLLYFTGDIEFQRAVGKVVKRLLKTGALRQLAGILGAMVFVRYGLEPLIKNIRVMMKAQGSWEKSSEFYILREVLSERTPATAAPAASRLRLAWRSGGRLAWVCGRVA